MSSRSETQTPIFVLSSGRAGSTLLARMIHRHPRLLCASDLFEPVGEEPYFDRRTRIDGTEFFQILSRPSFPQRIAYWRAQPTDELLFLPEEDEQVSLLVTYTLPFLTGGDPTELFGEVRRAVEGFGEDSPAGHLTRFFDWLRDRFEKDLWVERTGGSLPHTAKILDTWPQAKIVHNFRDSREVAISMLTGSFFRLYLELTKNPDMGAWDWTVTPPVDELGAMLNGWVVDALEALERVPAERKCDLSYEDLVGDTEATLLDLACFLLDKDEPGPEDREWARRQSTFIRKVPLRFPLLPAAVQRRLELSCREALEALGYLSAERSYG